MNGFETERLILRNYTMDDVPAVHESLSNEEVSRYEDFWPQTVEEVAEDLSDWKDMDNRMAVVLKETGELIGSVGFLPFLHGVHPYAYSTPKQMEAMDQAGVACGERTIYSLVYEGLKNILNNERRRP